MSLQEKINAAWKDALKQRNPSKDVLALMRTELKNKAISSREAGNQTTELSDELALTVFAKMAKQRRESIATFKSGGREDLVAKEETELKVIESYLPTQMSDDDIKKIVEEVIASTGASSMKDMGKVMGPVMAKTKGQADGKRVQDAVRALLA